MTVDKPLISLRNVTVSFPTFSYEGRSLQKLLAGSLLKRNKAAPRVASSLTIENADFFPGDRVGLIGRNGSGKTTLLKTLGGIYVPGTGQMTITGTTECIIDLEIGMSEDASGLENIELVGMGRGWSRREIAKCIDDVILFSDLGDFINLPIRAYSAGMRLRLAFAIATMSRPDILLIDEIFGVGDTDFQIRAKMRVQSLMAQSSVMLFASHDNALIRAYCNKVMWIDKGTVRFFGDLEKGLTMFGELIGDNHLRTGVPSETADRN